MTEARRAELESLIDEAVALVLGLPASPESSPAPEGPQGLASSFVALGSVGHAGLAAGRDYVLDPSGLCRGQATAFSRFRELQPRLRAGSLMVLAGLSLFEIEALGSATAGYEFSEALVHVLGAGGRVILGADHRERFQGLKGGLATRLGKALAELKALGVETAEADPRKAPPRPSPRPFVQASRLGTPAQGALRVVTVENLRGMAPGSVLRLAQGAIISPLARDEARAKGISLE